jgi:hypothetical protein
MPQLAEDMEQLDAIDELALIYGSSAVTYTDEAVRMFRKRGHEDVYKTSYFRDLQLSPIFNEAYERLRRMANLRQNWDTYGAEPPNLGARSSASRVISILESVAMPPTKVVPSSEGGVAICFIEGSRYADIECLNTGETLAVVYVGTGEPHAWEIQAQDQALTGAIEQIRAHFAA